MPGRRQKATDEDVFAAAQRAMSRRGPHELTLADIAEEAGVKMPSFGGYILDSGAILVPLFAAVTLLFFR